MLSSLRRVGVRAATMRMAAVSGAKVSWAPRRFLADTVGRELVDEQSFYDEMEKPSVPAGWTVSYSEGSGYFRMTRTADGAELLVDCEFKAHEVHEDGETTGFTVFLTKNNVTADFTLCYSSNDNSIVLEGMTTYKSKATACDLTPQAVCDRENHYEGPNIEDLEKTEINVKVMELLGKYGIDATFGEFVHKQSQVLEQTAYMNFLKDLKQLA